MRRQRVNSDGKRKELERLIEAAVVDCYTEDEQHEAFAVMLDDHLPGPFRARIMGEEVEVLKFEREGSGSVLAVCRHRGRRYRMNATAIEWIGVPPAGSRWLDAYRVWLKGI